MYTHTYLRHTIKNLYRQIHFGERYVCPVTTKGLWGLWEIRTEVASAPSRTPSGSLGRYKLIWSFAESFMARRSLILHSPGTSTSWPLRLAGTSVCNCGNPHVSFGTGLKCPSGELGCSSTFFGSRIYMGIHTKSLITYHAAGQPLPWFGREWRYCPLELTQHRAYDSNHLALKATHGRSRVAQLCVLPHQHTHLF
jgi:hypothetical protein